MTILLSHYPRHIPAEEEAYPVGSLALDFAKGASYYVGPTGPRLLYANVPGTMHVAFGYPGYWGIVRYDRHVTKDSSGGCVPIERIVYNDIVLSDTYDLHGGTRFTAGSTVHIDYDPRPDGYADGQIAVVVIRYDDGSFRSATDPADSTLPSVDLGATATMDAVLNTDSPVFHGSLCEYVSRPNIYYNGTLVQNTGVDSCVYGVFNSRFADLRQTADSIAG